MSTPKPHSTVATRMSGIREDWLLLTREEVLEPDLAIVDPHHHLWDFPAARIPIASPAPSTWTKTERSSSAPPIPRQ